MFFFVLLNHLILHLELHSRSLQRGGFPSSLSGSAPARRNFIFSSIIWTIVATFDNLESFWLKIYFYGFLNLAALIILCLISTVYATKTNMLRDHYVWSNHTYTRCRCKAGALFCYTSFTLCNITITLIPKENIRCSITCVSLIECLLRLTCIKYNYLDLVVKRFWAVFG